MRWRTHVLFPVAVVGPVSKKRGRYLEMERSSSVVSPRFVWPPERGIFLEPVCLGQTNV